MGKHLTRVVVSMSGVYMRRSSSLEAVKGLDRLLIFRSSRRVVAPFEAEDGITPLEGFYTMVTLPWSGSFSNQESGGRCR